MAKHEFTEQQIEAGLMRAFELQEVKVVPGLIALLALQNPKRADEILQTIQRGLDAASALAESETKTETGANAGRSSSRRSGCGQPRFADADDTIDTVRQWFDRSEPGRFREQYRSALRFASR